MPWSGGWLPFSFAFSAPLHLASAPWLVVQLWLNGVPPPPGLSEALGVKARHKETGASAHSGAGGGREQQGPRATPEGVFGKADQGPLKRGLSGSELSSRTFCQDGNVP